ERYHHALHHRLGGGARSVPAHRARLSVRDRPRGAGPGAGALGSTAGHGGRVRGRWLERDGHFQRLSGRPGCGAGGRRSRRRGRRVGAGSPGEVSCGRPRRAEPERPRRQGRRHGRGTDGSHSLTNAPVPELALPPQQVEELMQVLSKGITATQLYLPNNPVYQRAVDNIRAAFRQIWQATDDLVFDVGETEMRWEDNVVYSQDQRNESIAWTLFKDG